MSLFFFFNDTATTEIYPLPLHDALPILHQKRAQSERGVRTCRSEHSATAVRQKSVRSEEHTSELQSQSNLVCRLLLEKKKRSRTSRSWTTRPTSATLTTSTPHSTPRAAG